MRKFLRQFLFAVLAWSIPFAASVCLYPLKRSQSPLFDSLMGVVLVVSTVALFAVESRRIATGHVTNAIWTGLLWMAANWAFDACMFSAGPMKMSLGRYAADIGSAYLMIPVITIGMGMMSARARHFSPPAPAM